MHILLRPKTLTDSLKDEQFPDDTETDNDVCWDDMAMKSLQIYKRLSTLHARIPSGMDAIQAEVGEIQKGVDEILVIVVSLLAAVLT